MIVGTEAIEDAAPDDDASDALPEPTRTMPRPTPPPDATTEREQATTGITTVSLFDYMATQASAQRKGKRAKVAPAAAQLLLFDLFDQQPTAVAARAAEPAEPEFDLLQLELFAVPPSPIKGEPLPIVPIDRYDPIGDSAQRLGVSRKTAEGCNSRAPKMGREAAENQLDRSR